MHIKQFEALLDAAVMVYAVTSDGGEVAVEKWAALNWAKRGLVCGKAPPVARAMNCIVYLGQDLARDPDTFKITAI